MHRNFSRLVQKSIELLLIGFFVTLFIPLKLRLFEPIIFLSGDFNPYTTSYLYLSDVFFFVALLLIGIRFFFFPEDKEVLSEREMGMRDWPFILFFSLLIIASLISFFVSLAPAETLLFSWRWVQMLAFYLVISRKILSLDTIVRLFVWAMILQSVVAGMQYLKGESLGLAFLGEPFLRIGEPGVATVALFGKTILRGYGTFLHPNIFAAYAIFGIFLSLLYRKTRPLFFSIAIVFLIFSVMISFSRMALFALVLFLLFLFYPKRWHFSPRSKILILSGTVTIAAIGFFSGMFHTLLARFQFTDIAALQFRYANFVDGMHLFLQAPFGVGLGGSTTAMQTITSLKYAPWQYQPAHNLLLVVGNELGIFGLFIFFIGIIFLFRYLYLYRQTRPLYLAIGVSFLCLSLSDHYFFTLYHGQIILVLLFSFLVQVEPESSPNSH